MGLRSSLLDGGVNGDVCLGVVVCVHGVLAGGREGGGGRDMCVYVCMMCVCVCVWRVKVEPSGQHPL